MTRGQSWIGSMGRTQLATRDGGARQSLMLLALPSTIPKEKWGAKLCEFLYGEAEEVCEGIPLEKLTSEGGYKLIFETLDSRYADLEQDAMQKYLNEYFFRTQIKAGETYRNLTIRVETAYRNLQEVKVTLPEEVRGWFLLRKLALDKNAEAMLLTATGGSLKYDAINRAVKSVFPQGKCNTVANRMKDVYAAEEEDGTESQGREQDGEELDVFQIVADQIQGQEQYDEEDALDVLETYQDIRRKVQQKRTGRGFRPTATTWNLTGTVRGKLDQLKQKTRCHICKQPGHWKKECPQKRDGHGHGAVAKGSSAKDAMITESGEEGEHHGWFISEDQITDLEVFLVEGRGDTVDIVCADRDETDENALAEVMGDLEQPELFLQSFCEADSGAAKSSEAYMAVLSEASGFC